METKKCSKCGEVKPVGEFYKFLNKKDGLSSWCKKCFSDYKKNWNKENKEKVKKDNKKYFEENKENILKCRKKYRKENREKILKCRKKWIIENKDKIKNYREKNIIKINNKRYSLKIIPDEIKPLIELAIISRNLNKKIKNIGESK